MTVAVERHFTQSPPTKPGLYWYTLVEGGRRYHCDVFLRDGVLIALCADGKHKPVTEFARWWSTEFLREPGR